MGELVKVFFEQIKELDGKQYMDHYLRYQLSPLIQGVKPSMTININKQKEIGAYWEKYGIEIMSNLDLKWVVLRETEKTKIILVYDTVHIKRLIQSEDVAYFLKALDYEVLEVEAVIQHLIKRYSVQHCPHELGIFLGIPLHDVIAFITSEEKCLLCGYWKVYSNLEYAVQQFKKYDDTKETMLKKLIAELRGA